MLVSHLVLLYGASQEKKAPLILFFTISISVIILYWAHFAYLKYSLQDGEASKEVIKFIISMNSPQIQV